MQKKNNVVHLVPDNQKVLIERLTELLQKAQDSIHSKNLSFSWTISEEFEFDRGTEILSDYDEKIRFKKKKIELLEQWISNLVQARSSLKEINQDRNI